MINIIEATVDMKESLSEKSAIEDTVSLMKALAAAVFLMKVLEDTAFSRRSQQVSIMKEPAGHTRTRQDAGGRSLSSSQGQYKDTRPQATVPGCMSCRFLLSGLYKARFYQNWEP